jgi:diguanylate cyclase (GGDEF)-like protein
VGHIIADTLVGKAVACRYGGDEFAIVLAAGDVRSSLAAAEQLRKAVENHAPILVGGRFPAGTLTISVGIAGYLPDKGRDPGLVGEELFRAADHALYQAKREGRNCVRRSANTTAVSQVHAEPGQTALPK